MAGYAKVFSDIVHSTVWREDVYTKVVWITMLVMADRHGLVMASIPGLADAAKVSIDQCLEALTVLSSPDKYSRTKEYEGRRIDDVDGGWLLLNFEKFRARKDDEEQRIRTADRVRRHRQKLAEQDKNGLVTENVTVTPRNPIAEASSSATPEADSFTKKTTPLVETHVSTAVPFEEILNLYHQSLPELPRCIKLTKQRKGYIRQRWQEDFPDLDSWGTFFGYVRQSKFLMGKAPPRNGGEPFRATLDWLCKPENCVKVVEKKYG